MSAILSAVGLGKEAPHVHHPAADQSVTYKGYAAYGKKEDLKPLEYNPHKLDADFVELAISHCGICGSDIHTIDSGWGPSSYPVIVGHEIVGTVTAVGSSVTHVKVGDRVGVGAQCSSCLNRKGDCYECERKQENHCSKALLGTYNSKYPDGQVTQGGYADKFRCNAAFAFLIPDAISSAEAAPLMCAGVTTYAPLARSITKKGMRVGIIGVGGLGHLGIMWASKLLDGSAEVTAISHNAKKKDEALKMGATRFLDTSDEKQVKEHARYFDYILCTANGKGQDYNTWISTVRLEGTFCSVGLPEEPVPIMMWSLLGAQVNFTASGIGSIEEIKSMLDFAAKHNVRPIIQKMPMDKVNDGIKSVRDGSVRFRVVLENAGAGQ